MESQDISKIVQQHLSSFVAEPADPDSVVGNPWSKEKIESYIPQLQKALVQPTLENFLLKETPDQLNSEQYAQFWVVAKDQDYIQWYDPTTDEFGLGHERDGHFISIGVRGDLVGVYCAM